MVLLIAPAGYGKTSLAVEWLAPKRAAWYRATSAAADVAAFSAGIAQAVTALIPGAGQRLRQRLRGADLSDASAESLAELLAEDLQNWPAEAWLAIDDYHLVRESEAVEKFVERVLEMTSVRLAVTARDRPEWASARKILYGEIVELGVDQLAMTEEEARLALGDAPTSDITRFIERAEGWPALVAVARLFTPVDAPVSRTSGALFRYFAEEILRREPAHVQAFMLAAAVPETIDVEAAASVLGVAGAASALERLVDVGLVRESEGTRLRFHPLLREFLREKLRADDEPRFVSVAEHAIEHATSLGLYGDALDLAFEVGGEQLVADVLVDVVAQLLAVGKIETVDRWLALLGPSVLRQPPLAAAQAEVLIRRGNLLEGASLAYDLAQRLSSDDAWYSRAWYLAGHGFLHVSKYDLALECLKHARDAARTEHEITTAYVTSIHVEYNLGRPDVGELVDEFARSLPQSLAAQLWLAQCRVLVTTAQGTLAPAWDTLEPLTPVARYVEDPALRAVFVESAAAVATFRADYEQGLSLACEAVKVCRDFRLPAVKTMFSLLFQAAAAIGLRRFAEAEAALEEVSRSGLRQTRHLLAAEAADRVRLLLARRRIGDAVGVARAIDPGGLPPVTLGEILGLTSIAEAAAENLDRAEACADRALNAGSSAEGIFYARFGLLLASLGAAAGCKSRRLAALSLVRDAAAAGVLDAFVVAYRAYPPLLALVAEDEETFPIVARVVRAANDVELARDVGVLLPEIEPGERFGSLTQREVEVFGLISEGLSNAEIARRLFVSQSTVKVHVHHILEKLGAKTRLQAVLMAK
ncbi:MAG: LuxR C-terminal-related transcriptional regulator [Actinomycetota bacterium]|nr:LuxR C-terminal-related transcriptional regulator [Actinomycetota bacterium]